MKNKTKKRFPVQKILMLFFLLAAPGLSPLQAGTPLKRQGVPNESVQQDAKTVRGKVTDTKGQPLPGVTVVIKGSTTGTITDADGNYNLAKVPDNATLVFSFVGMKPLEMSVSGRTQINVTMEETTIGIEEVVAVGYGTQKKESLTGAISGVESEKLETVKGATVSASLAGQIPGVSFRQADGRPGATADVQIRNFGDPLYIIDGIEKDATEFNQISSSDIESISVLKDASASIYGVRAGNGVVIVTTKRGKADTPLKIRLNAYTGWQNMMRLPETVNAYQYMIGKARAEMNAENPTTEITESELAKWKEGTEYGYKSFDWADFMIESNAPQNSINISASGGSEKIQFYVSYSHLDQTSVLGREFKFYRHNMQSNVDAQVTDRLKLGVQINGRIDVHDNPGVPQGDDFWNPVRILYTNRPTERPYANDNPDYIQDLGSSHNEQNWALFTKDISGYALDNSKVLGTNFSLDYDIPIKGLTAQGKYSYNYFNELINEHEYTYDTYTYYPEEDNYEVTFSMTNPWRRRVYSKTIGDVLQGKLNYDNTFGKHHVAGTFVAERIHTSETSTTIRTLPEINELPLMYYDDLIVFSDSEEETARIGYITRLNYNYGRKYYLELIGRYDGSWKFSKGNRWGFFPSFLAGWRITEEKFMKNFLNESDFDLKLRVSYGVVGDDDVGIEAFDYMSGYDYGSSLQIIDGEAMSGARDRGEPVTNITWYTNHILNIGFDYSFFNNKLHGSVDYFNRIRKGLEGTKYDILIPSEVGYTLSEENINSDSNVGVDGSIEYRGKSKKFSYTLGMNFTYARKHDRHTYKPRFSSAWDEYSNSTEKRWSGTVWGYNCIGQFQSMDEIHNYQVDIDGKGNSTLLPGDLIYEDINGDSMIDEYDERPIGYPTGEQPILSFGFLTSFKWKNIDFSANFSAASMYSYNLSEFSRVPFYSNGTLLKRFYDDSWHREDPFDLNSKWIPGTYPALRVNNSDHSNYNKTSTFWLKNVWYFRARSIEMGYTLPSYISKKAKLEKVRLYVNTYNLFSFDNMKKYNLDPEVADTDNSDYPQHRVINVGIDVTF